MKKRLISLLLVAAMLAALGCTALADPNSGGAPIGNTLTGTINNKTPSTSVVFVTDTDDLDKNDAQEGEDYSYNKQPGTTKQDDGSVSVDVSGVMPDKYIPDVNVPEGYELTGWAIKDKSGELIPIDLATYEFRKYTEIYPILTPLETEDEGEEASPEQAPPALPEEQAETPAELGEQDEAPAPEAGQPAQGPEAGAQPIEGVYETGKDADPRLFLIDYDHFAYVNGFPDGTFQPYGNLTRAQVCAIFYRLLADKTMYGEAKQFSDLAADHWAYTEIQVMADRGIVNGYPTGDFKPEDPIKRSEFLKMAASFFELEAADMSFADVAADYWANAFIASAVAKGWIPGDGFFRPEDYITRAEAVQIANKMIGRAADVAYVDANYLTLYPDVVKGQTEGFYDIIEASVAHEFVAAEGSEVWNVQ